MLIICIIASLLVIFFLSLMDKEVEFSEFELNRRIESGDNRAEKLLIRKQLTPSLNVIFRFFAAIFVVILTASLAKMLDFWPSLIAAGVVILVLMAISGADFIHKMVAKKAIYKIYALYGLLSAKTQKRILKIGRKKQPWAFYSKAELMFFLGKHSHILADDEQKWVGRIFELSQKKVIEVGASDEKMAILHTDDLLTPMIIDELFKTKQKFFAVMDTDETEVLGIVKMDEISQISGGDSKVVKQVMREEFTAFRAEKSALEVFEKMANKGENFAILTTKNGDLAGCVNLADFMRKNKS